MGSVPTSVFATFGRFKDLDLPRYFAPFGSICTHIWTTSWRYAVLRAIDAVQPGDHGMRVEVDLLFSYRRYFLLYRKIRCSEKTFRSPVPK